MISAETSDVITAAKALPVEARAAVVDSLVDSLYSDDEHIAEHWKAEVESRIAAYRRGDTNLVAAVEVFDKAKKLLTK